MSLSSADQSLLREILRTGHEIERNWPPNPPALNRLRELMASVRFTSSPDLQRLSKWAEHLHDDLSLRHFFALVVPFERLAQRALRDDEFLITTQDLSAEAAAESARQRQPLAVVLENIRSAFNVGAIFRTAECLAAEHVLLSGYTPDPSESKTARTAMGTGDLLSWERYPRTQDACKRLKNDGYALVALETVATAPSVHEFQFAKKTAFILGNERFGLEADVLHLADAVCRIPVHGRKNSLNVGITFGIAAYEWLRQTR